MKWIIKLWVFFLLTSGVNANPHCTVEIIDLENSIHQVVESCSSIGSFSLGARFNGQWERLTFQYPQPWRGTYATFEIDGEYYCTSEDPRNCTLADKYVIEKPNVVDDEIKTVWEFGGVKITQKLRAARNTSHIKYEVENRGDSSHQVAIRIQLDTMIGLNDGAPIYIPAHGLITKESSFEDIDFGYWKAFNHGIEPSIIGTAWIDPKLGYTLPEKIQITDWKKSKDHRWSYSTSGNLIDGDSGLLIYYDLGTLAVNDSDSILFGFGVDKPVIEKQESKLHLTEVTLDKISGKYCPNSNVKIRIDSLGTVDMKDAKIQLQILDGGIKVFEDVKWVDMEALNVVTTEFIWFIPDTEKNIRYDIIASVGNASTILDETKRSESINVDLSGCGRIVIGADVPKNILGGAAIISLALFAGLIATVAAYLWFNRGSVKFTKIIEDEMVYVQVFNETPKTMKNLVLEDNIPSDSEIRVETMDVLRRDNSLTWKVLKLKPYEKATMAYWIKNGRGVGHARLKWDKGYLTSN